MEIERKELDEQRDRLLKQQGRLRLRAEVRYVLPGMIYIHEGMKYGVLCIFPVSLC